LARLSAVSLALINLPADARAGTLKEVPLTTQTQCNKLIHIVSQFI